MAADIAASQLERLGKKASGPFKAHITTKYVFVHYYYDTYMNILYCMYIDFEIIISLCLCDEKNRGFPCRSMRGALRRVLEGAYEDL